MQDVADAFGSEIEALADFQKRSRRFGVGTVAEFDDGEVARDETGETLVNGGEKPGEVAGEFWDWCVGLNGESAVL